MATLFQRFDMKLFASIFLLLLPMVATAQKTAQRNNLNDTAIASLKFLGEYDIPHNQKFKGTTIGGLSGIDYDRASGVYYLVSDDRSAINPARFYTAKIHFSPSGVDSVSFLSTRTFLQPDGGAFPSAKTDIYHTVDPESIRFNPKTSQVIWSTEGERIPKANPPVLIDAVVNIATRDGKFVKSIPMPDLFKMAVTENGPRQNGTLEGIAFDSDFKTMYVSFEEPRFEDGQRADTVKIPSWTRILAFDAITGKNVAQYAYGLEAVAHPAIPPTAFKINGISEILWLGKDKLLTIERSFSTGSLACTIKVFVVDLAKATHVESVSSLKDYPPASPARKRLLTNMDDLGIFVDNVEGVTFGPPLPNGHRTLLFITDNNFFPFEKSQVLLFEVMP